jgi:hypothetical protein
MSVYVTKVHGARPRCYHTDRQCSSIRDESDVREYELESLPWDVPECEWCAGDVDKGAATSPHFKALKEASKGGESA